MGVESFGTGLQYAWTSVLGKILSQKAVIMAKITFSGQFLYLGLLLKTK